MESNWYQQALTPPEVLQVTIKVGVIPSTDHVQAMVELSDPTTGVLQGQWSAPHQALRELPHVLEWARSQALDALNEATEPF